LKHNITFAVLTMLERAVLVHWNFRKVLIREGHTYF